MLKITNLSNNLLISVNITELDRVIDKGVWNKIIENLLKFQKYKNIKNCERSEVWKKLLKF